MRYRPALIWAAAAFAIWLALQYPQFAGHAVFLAGQLLAEAWTGFLRILKAA